MPSPQPRDPEWIEHAPLRIDRRAEIAAAPADVWQRFADNETWVDWFPGFKTCRFVSDSPHGVGSVRVLQQDQFKVTESMTAWDPAKRWGMTVTKINAPIIRSMAEDVHFSGDRGHTTINFSIGIELTSLGRLLRRPLLAKTGKNLDLALTNLAQIMSS